MVTLDPATALRVAVPAVSGAIAAAVAAVSVRRLRRGEAHASLARPFIALAAVVAVVGIGYPVVRARTSFDGRTIWLGYHLVIVPWTVFALRYVGRGKHVTRGRIFLGCAVVAGVVVANVVVILIGPEQAGTDWFQSLATALSVATLLMLTLVFAMIVVVVAATYRHSRLSTGQGLAVVTPVVSLILALQVTRPSTPLLNDVLIGAALATVATTLALAVTRYDVLDRLPGTRTLGERAALTETDEAILVLDDERRVTRANRSARRTFGDVDTLSDVTEYSLETLADRTTIDCWTTTGTRQFDPNVTVLTGEFDETLGYTLTLIDVTEREIRRQRLAVLNRILRHNVRNQLDVIRAHAERADLDPAIRGVDRLEDLSGEVRRIERLMERSNVDPSEADLPSLLDEVVATATDGVPADATVTAPEVTVTVDGELCRYAIYQFVENAVQHNDTPTPRVAVRAELADTGIRIVIADDGPGIPESELAAIEAGDETPLDHASSLGLWGANWAVQTMGGSLSFEDSDLGGTAVVVDLPDVEADEST